MELYQLGRTLHIAVGTVTLATFWLAALARKGGVLHRRAGRVYLLSLIGILATAFVMLAAQLRSGDTSMAAFIAFLSVYLGTSAWLAWFSIRRQADPALLIGWTYKALASLNIATGVLMIGLFLITRIPIILVLSSVGLGVGWSMWRLALRTTHDRLWWLELHMNAATVNFGATHDTFLALAVGSVVPMLREPWIRAFISLVVLSIALGLRIWLGRRYLGSRRTTDGISSRSFVSGSVADHSRPLGTHPAVRSAAQDRRQGGKKLVDDGDVAVL